MYLLLLGTTALSLVSFIKVSMFSTVLKNPLLKRKSILLQVSTPILFKLIPALMHLGVTMQWFPSESGIHDEVIYLSVTSYRDFVHASHFITRKCVLSKPL